MTTGAGSREHLDSILAKIDLVSLNAVQRRCLSVLRGDKANEELRQAALTMLRAGGVTKKSTRTKAPSMRQQPAVGGAWACPACTAKNGTDAAVCVVCAASRQGACERDKPAAALTWPCERCTLQNSARATKCKACGESRIKETRSALACMRPPQTCSDDDDDFAPPKRSKA
jgi:hypothetical protein